jgi:hypothetical protein
MYLIFNFKTAFKKKPAKELCIKRKTICKSSRGATMPVLAIAIVKLVGEQLKWTSSEFISWAQKQFDIPAERLLVLYRPYSGHCNCFIESGKGCCMRFALQPGVKRAVSFCNKFEVCCLEAIDVFFGRDFVATISYTPTFGELAHKVALHLQVPADVVRFRLTTRDVSGGPFCSGGPWFAPEEAMLPPSPLTLGLALDVGYRIPELQTHSAPDAILDLGLPDLPNCIIRSMLTRNLDITGIIAQFTPFQPYYQLRVPGRFELLYVSETNTVVIKMLNPNKLRALFIEQMNALFSVLRINIQSSIEMSGGKWHNYNARDLETHMQHRGKQPFEIVCSGESWHVHQFVLRIMPLGLLYCSNRSALIEDESGVRSCMVYTSVRDAERYPDLVKHASKVFRFTSEDIAPVPVDRSTYCKMTGSGGLEEFMRHLPLVSLPKYKFVT